jgi:hypothetical protein
VPLPETDQFRRPTLEALAGGRPMHIERIRDRVQESLGVSNEDRAELPPRSPTPVFTNYVAFALVYLQGRGFIEKTSSKPNTYKISESGERALADGLDLERISPRGERRPLTSGGHPLGGEPPDTQNVEPGAQFTPSDEEPQPSPSRTRPFDPERPPEPSDFRWIDLDLEATHQLKEKARQSHHEILVALDRWLRAQGWVETGEIPGSIDLWAISPEDRRWIFEAKTIRDDNHLSQTRSALAQLLEYRLAHGSENDALCLASDRAIPAPRAALLGQLGVAVVVVGDSSVDPLNELWS